MKKLAVLVCLLVLASLALADGYEKGKIAVGPLLGYGPNGLAIGAHGEYGVTDKISAGGIASYSSKTEDLVWYKWTVTYITVGAQGNYHFKPAQKFDPFVGLILGYDVASASVTWADQYSYMQSYTSVAAASEMVIGGDVGANYYFSPKMAGVARVGYPFYFSAGINFVF